MTADCDVLKCTPESVVLSLLIDSKTLLPGLIWFLHLHASLSV